MTYNFDEVVDRTNTSCIKWDARQGVFGNPEVLPLWVADMDFRSPQFVIDAIAQRLTHPVLGYTLRPDSYFEAIIGWVKRRNGWSIERDWIAHCPGVVPGLNVAVLAYTNPGDRIVIQTPVYPPFFDAVNHNGRTLVENPLTVADGRFVIDFDDLDQKLAGAKAIILSNPHNPVGRVFDEEELRRIGELCLKHGVTIISDEIHSDIILPPHRHLHIANLDERFAAASVTFMAPSKTFNLAGLSTAYAVIPNAERRARYLHVLEQQLHLGMGNIAGIVGLEAAYRHGDEWLDQLVTYIKGNADLLEELLKAMLPKVTLYKPEGTYLAWMDFSAYGLDDDALDRKLIHEAQVGLNSGSTFGTNGRGFRRINLACPRAYVKEAVERMARVL
ncbi:MalY/PatB family protein [uncultured Acetobacteroides sp.]|uniref:MalY/PatB family protein n=1 Tax=uncultured Acetobacteroides sp. TaxID=1760811 RepID=UPI0029F5273C|nr:MalY/PatB family protein [uncultured Acetobacteroides sp.]